MAENKKLWVLDRDPQSLRAAEIQNIVNAIGTFLEEHFEDMGGKSADELEELREKICAGGMIEKQLTILAHAHEVDDRKLSELANKWVREYEGELSFSQFLSEKLEGEK
jgi:ElaB/YqjD/DUF883 family membrane-anchored ribosome-binding protein